MLHTRTTVGAAVLTLAISAGTSGCTTTMKKSEAPPERGAPVVASADRPVGGGPAVARPIGRPAAGTAVAPHKGQRALDELAQRRRAAARKKDFAAFKAAVYREPFAGGKYIVNGDTPIADDKQLREFFETQVVADPPPATDPQSLIHHPPNGVKAVWTSSQKKQLTYCVSETFGVKHDQVVADMDVSGKAWSTVAAVEFVHLAVHDPSCGPTNEAVLFDVRPVNVNGEYLARAFFPDEPRSGRNVLIDGSALNIPAADKLSLRGILRHELGHTLGFRHEHTRPDSGTCFEDDDWSPVTNYDAFSVMHYPQCNGAGDWTLNLTGTDKSGAACVYGEAPGFTIDTSVCRGAEEPSGRCAAKTQAFTRQQVAKAKDKEYGPFSVGAGTPFEARMVGDGQGGDPDLYVRFGGKPTATTFSCRPYLSGADESCSLDAPGTATQAFVRVHGYAPGSYHLFVVHTP